MTLRVKLSFDGDIFFLILLCQNQEKDVSIKKIGVV